MMKKMSLFIVLVFAVLFITACAQSNTVPNTNVDSNNDNVPPNTPKTTPPVDNLEGCTDSDGGLNEKVFGYVTDNNGRFNDSCLNPSTVKETKCGIAGFVDYTSIECVAGYACEKGVCVKTDVNTQSLCTDSDGGLDQYTKGSVTDKSGKTVTDECLNNRQVKEYKCGSADYSSSTYIDCANGCVNGACVK